MRSHTANLLSLLIAAVLSLGLAQAAMAKGKPVKVEVTAAQPGEAFQGEEIDVTVSGSGFDSGSSVSYLVTGTTDGSQVDVISVEYVSATELKTRIRPKDNAAVTAYDIEVQNSSGRKGKGTTLFRVKATETTCTGEESKEPTIAFLTETDRSGEVYTADIFLSTTSGCDQYLLVEDAHQYLPDTKQNEGVNRFIKAVRDLRFATRGNFGVVSWHDSYQDPWVQMGITFMWDSNGIVLSGPSEPWPMFNSLQGHDIVDADVRINEFGDVVLVMTEWSVDDTVRLISTYNVDTTEYEVISSGDCQVEDSSGECFVPYLYSIRWSPDGQTIYFSPRNSLSGNDRKVLARMRWLGNSWSEPELVMETAPGHQSLNLGTISVAGLLTYRVEEVLTNKGGKVRGWQRADGLVDLSDCALTPCWSDDGVKLPSLGINQVWIWTPFESLLIKEQSGTTFILGEMADPITGARTPLSIEGVRVFDSSL
jgi:hypothetical protein